MASFHLTKVPNPAKTLATQGPSDPLIPTKLAFNYVFPTAPRIAPLAIRASTGRERRSNQHYSTAVFAAVNSRERQLSRNLLQRPSPSFLSRCSAKISPDELLLGIIESEIQSAVESLEEDQAEVVPQSFPFKIEDNPQEMTITLTREYQGETITVEVHMPFVTGEDDDEDDDDDDDDDDDGEQKAGQSSIPLVVRTSKKGGPFLEFGCTAYPDEIVIDSLLVEDPENSDGQIAYEEPDFAALDENLQKALHKYLEIRGITSSTSDFMHGYMVDKVTREYIKWLQKLRKYVQA